MIDFLAVIKEQVEQSLRTRQAGRERQDAGARVSGSRKEMAALRKLSLHPGELMRVEASPVAAAALVRKNQVFPRPDFEAWRTKGVLSPANAGFLFLLWKTFPDKPKGVSAFDRMAYTRLGQALDAYVQDAVTGMELRGNPSLLLLLEDVQAKVFGYNTAAMGAASAHLVSMTGTAARGADYPIVREALTAARRFVPADDFVRWTMRCLLHEKWAPDRFEELTRQLYGFSEADSDEAGKWLWVIAEQQLLATKRAVGGLTERSAAHTHENDRYDYASMTYLAEGTTVFAPRVVARYYGTGLASLLFTKRQYSLTKQALWGNKAAGLHPAWTRLQALDSAVITDSAAAVAAWAACATLVGIAPAAGEPATKPAGAGPTIDPERIPLTHIRRTRGIVVTDMEVHEQFLLSTFGFRAVEYGNWVGDVEANEHLRHFIGALTDLCDVLNLDPAKVHKIGGLSIAFGSRGGSGKKYKAAYYSDLRLMALTKATGDGSVAHEWLHYLDHVLTFHDQQLSGRGRFMSTRLDGSSEDTRQLTMVDGQLHTKLRTGRAPKLTTAQRAKLARDKEADDSVVQQARQEIEWAGYPLTGQDAQAVRLLRRVWLAIRNGYYLDGNALICSNPLATMQKVTISTSKNYGLPLSLPAVPVALTITSADSSVVLPTAVIDLVAMVRRGRQTVDWLWQELQTMPGGYRFRFMLNSLSEIEDTSGRHFFAKIGYELGVEKITVPFTLPVVSQFYQYAAADKKADYFADPVELFARSFERFVYDELAARGQANNYLVNDWKFSSANALYPSGAEAELINKAWREFFAFLSGPAALGPFVAPWAKGQRVDEYLAFGKKSGGNEQVTGGIITPAPTEAAAAGLELAKAQLRLRAMALALARARQTKA